MTRLLVALCSLSTSCTVLFSPDPAGSDAAINADARADGSGVPSADADLSVDAGIAPYDCTDQDTEALYHFDGTLVDECMRHPLDGTLLFGNGHVSGNAYGEVAVSQGAFPDGLPLSFDFWYRLKGPPDGVLIAVRSGLGASPQNVMEIRQVATALQLTVWGIGCTTPLSTVSVQYEPPVDEFVHVSASIRSDGVPRLSVLNVDSATDQGGIACTDPTDVVFLHVGGVPGANAFAFIEELRVSDVVRPPHQFP